MSRVSHPTAIPPGAPAGQPAAGPPASAADCQTTLASAVELEGRGLHGGQPCVLRLLPAPPDHGVRFARVDLPDEPEIPADIDAVVPERLERQTVLRSPDHPEAVVQTVEHVLAVVHGMGLDNVRIEMTGPEPPNWDGSAAPIADAVARAGHTIAHGTMRRVARLDRPLAFRPGGGSLVEFVAWPSECLTVTYFLSQDHPVIGAQTASFRLSPDLFHVELAPARTFCTIEEVEYLRSRGLIQGGSAESAVVVGRDRILNTELRWSNELARHKLLDLLGDLLLVGAPVRAHVMSFRGGHQANARFVQHLRKEITLS